MSKIDQLVIRTKNKIIKSKECGLLHLMKKKVYGDETLIIKVFLIVVAAALVIIFRDQIGSMISSLTNKASTKVESMYE